MIVLYRNSFNPKCHKTRPWERLIIAKLFQHTLISCTLSTYRLNQNNSKFLQRNKWLLKIFVSFYVRFWIKLFILHGPAQCTMVQNNNFFSVGGVPAKNSKGSHKLKVLAQKKLAFDMIDILLNPIPTWFQLARLCHVIYLLTWW